MSHSFDDIENQVIQQMDDYDEMLQTDSFDLLMTESFEDIDLCKFYNLIYGKSRRYTHRTRKDFYHYFIEVMGNRDIEVS